MRRKNVVMILGGIFVFICVSWQSGCSIEGEVVSESGYSSEGVTASESGQPAGSVAASESGQSAGSVTASESGQSDEARGENESGQTASGSAGSFSEDILKAVLLGDAPFSYCSEGQAETMDITGVPALFDADDPVMKIFDFSIADLDGDGRDEVILFVFGVAGDTGGKVILHEADNGVYGYKTDNRTLVDLKTDGTYSYSDPTGMAEAGIAAISGFSGGGFTEEKIAYAAGTYEGWDTFTAGGEAVAEEEYMDMVSAQEEKQDAERYDFSAENIDAVF